VLEHDLIGANARAKRIDERRTKESSSETGKRAASRIATAILMYSFGGLRRDGCDWNRTPASRHYRSRSARSLRWAWPRQYNGAPLPERA
jgi:hypothetical protein